jgi:hypothetical protein
MELIISTTSLDVSSDEHLHDVIMASGIPHGCAKVSQKITVSASRTAAT